MFCRWIANLCIVQFYNIYVTRFYQCKWFITCETEYIINFNNNS